MSKPDYLDELIDKASKAAGNDTQLAQQLGVNKAAVSQWRKGTKPCPVADQAIMADLAGLPASDWSARALIAQYQGTAKGERLMQALGKTLVVTGAALVSTGAAAAQMISEGAAYFIRCIDSLSSNKTAAAHHRARVH